MGVTVLNYQEKLDIPKSEHEVLAFWDEIHAFERSVSERPESKRYVFYDGPPFATGLPHYGHILASTIKDVVPRYWTMKGYRVDRVWGWDCHGIPIENIVEKELALKGGKKGIEELGIDKFNAACRSAIFRFDKEWEKIIYRIGRWVDFKHSYKTMDATFMESVWWAFKALYEKNLVYEGRKVILYCPRCATPLSNFEIAMDNSYKDVEDNSVYVKFKVTENHKKSLFASLKNLPQQHKSAVEFNLQAPLYLVSWTTTPWTLPGNVALAVRKDAMYRIIYSQTNGGEFYVVADEFWKQNSIKLPHDSKELLGFSEPFVGQTLVGVSYEPLYTYMPLEGKKAHYVTDAEFVSLEDGTGIVHTAAIFGEDDYKLAVEKDLPCVPTLDDQGKFLNFVTPLAGVFYKKSEQWVIDDLLNRNLMYRAEKTVHSYPFCYRCETPLYFNAVPAWFIDIQKIKPSLVSENEHINWYPDHLKHGRFGKGLQTAPDWNISRSRYWGTPMPVWTSGAMKRIIGSLEELKTWAVDVKQVEALTDIHREYLDDIEVWVDDAKTIKGKRIPEVFDCWVESGSMPYASIHYPFNNKERFEQTHPAQFIAEYIAQTRAWFYTLHVMSVGLFGTHTFENAVTTGTILAEDGTKMSKSKKNFPDPVEIIERYGVDALRFYLMSSVVMKAENLNFSEAGVKEVYQKIVSIIWNVFSFYKLYAKVDVPTTEPRAEHVLDKWILSKLHTLVQHTTKSMDSYDTVSFCRNISVFVNELSTWYLRRSRDRISESQESQKVFGWILDVLVRVLAPVMPFISEKMYQNLHANADSVHLTSWPTYDETRIYPSLEEEMDIIKTIAEKAHAQRKASGVKLRQPLLSLRIVHDSKLSDDVLEVLRDEVNVLKVIHETGKDLDVQFDTTLTPELEELGKTRTVVREIQILRKEHGCRIDEPIVVQLPKEYETFSASSIATIQKETLASKIVWGNSLSILTG